MIELNFPNAVQDERDYFGRQIELARIETPLKSGKHVPVILIGEPRIGKTSTQNVVLQRMQCSEGLHFLSLCVEPRGIRSFNDFAGAVLMLLANQLEQEAGEWRFEAAAAGLSSDLESISQFEAVFRRLLGRIEDYIFLLCIDEFDEILRSTQDGERQKIMGLIHHMIERTDLPLIMFFTMTKLPDELQNEMPSPLITKSLLVDLAPLSPAELQTMAYRLTGMGSDSEKNLQSGAFIWDDLSLTYLYRLSGGHPYFAKLLLSYLLEQSASQADHSTTITVASLEKALANALRDIKVHHTLENLYSKHFSDAERELLLLLARLQTPLTHSSLKSAGLSWLKVARRLCKRHYLSDGGGAGFDWQIGFIGHWLRQWEEFEEECDRLGSLYKQLVEPPELVIDPQNGQVWRHCQPVKLSAQEGRIVQYLAQHLGQLVSREQLIDAVWQTEEGVSDQMVDTAFYRLRRKIDSQGKCIETVPGRGFVLKRAVLLSNRTH